MKWDHSIQITNGAAATADPIASPATVPAANCFRLAARTPGYEEVSTRVLLDLEAPVAESVSVELYALDDADDDGGGNPPTTGHWTRLCAFTALSGGRIQSCDLFAGGDGVAYQSGGLFYLRMVSESVAANRRVYIAGRPGNGAVGANVLPGVDIEEIDGEAIADAAGGVLPVVEIPQIISGPTSIIDDAGPPVVPVAITTAYAANASAWIALDDTCTDLALLLIAAGTTPTSIEVEILWHEAGVAADPTSFYTPVVNDVALGVEELAPRESSWVGRAGAVLANGRYRAKFERPAEAASYKVRIKRTGGDAATTAQVFATQIG